MDLGRFLGKPNYFQYPNQLAGRYNAALMHAILGKFARCRIGLLLFVLALGSVHAQTLNLNSASAVKGGTVSLNLSMNASSGSAVASLGWTLSYPPSDITSFNIVAGPALTAASKTLNCISTTGSLTCIASGMDTTTIGTGVVAVVTVTLALGTSNTSDSISISNLMGAYPDGTLASVTGTGGIITLSSPVPTISMLSPASVTAGAAGFSLTVNGTGFISGSVVNWNGSARTTTYGSSTHLTAAITAADIATAGTAQVTVFNPAPGGGTSGAAAFTINASNPVPIISTLSPASVMAGTAGFSLTVNGTGFISGSIVNWNGSARTTTYGSSTQLTAAITAADIAAAGTAHVTVFNPAPGGGTSGAAAFTINAAPANTPLLLLHADSSEVNGITNGSTVTPTIAPAGFTGSVVLNAGGSVNFAPAQTGNGVYFLNCCSNSSNAYYKFTGAALGSIFNTGQGQISFYLKSRYSFAQRQASAAAPRYAFDVRDGNGQHLFYFFTMVSSGYLLFEYEIAGASWYYYVPKGTEDALFGNGVILQVTLSWNGTAANLYFNGTLMKSIAYTPPSPNWTSAAVFDLGAYEYSTFGGYNISDDLIDEFTVLP